MDHSFPHPMDPKQNNGSKQEDMLILAQGDNSMKPSYGRRRKQARTPRKIWEWNNEAGLPSPYNEAQNYSIENWNWNMDR